VLTSCYKSKNPAQTFQRF